MFYKVIYTDKLIPAKFAAKTIGPVILMRPQYKDDTGAITGAWATTSTNIFNQTKVFTGAILPSGTIDQQAIVQVKYKYSSIKRSISE